MLVEYTQMIRNAEVKSRRLKMGLTQKQLGKKIGVSSASIGQIETFRAVSERTLEKLAVFFRVDPDTLVPPWIREEVRAKDTLLEAKERGGYRRGPRRRIPTTVTTYRELGSVEFERLTKATDRSTRSAQISVHALAELNEEAVFAIKAFESLPKGAKEVMEMYCNGYSLGQISKKTKQSKTWVYNLLNYGVQHILEKLPRSMREYPQEQVGALVSWGLHGSRPEHVTTEKMKGLMLDAPRGFGKTTSPMKKSYLPPKNSTQMFQGK